MPEAKRRSYLSPNAVLLLLIVVLVVPLPPALMDILIAANISLAVIVLQCIISTIGYLLFP